jgi:hypothetical protein
MKRKAEEKGKPGAKKSTEATQAKSQPGKAKKPKSAAQPKKSKGAQPNKPAKPPKNSKGTKQASGEGSKKPRKKKQPTHEDIVGKSAQMERKWVFEQQSNHSLSYATWAIAKNDNNCTVCHDGGDLVCCDCCPRTYHRSCLDDHSVDDESWRCPMCLAGHVDRCILSGEEGHAEERLLPCSNCPRACRYEALKDFGHELVLNSDSQWLCWKCQPSTDAPAQKSKGSMKPPTKAVETVHDVGKQDSVLAQVEALLEKLPANHFASIWGSRLRSIRLAKEMLTKRIPAKAKEKASGGSKKGAMPVIWDLQRHYTAEGTQLRLTHLLRDEPSEEDSKTGGRSAVVQAAEWDLRYQKARGGGAKSANVPSRLLVSARVQQFLEQGLCVCTPGLREDQVLRPRSSPSPM